MDDDEFVDIHQVGERARRPRLTRPLRDQGFIGLMDQGLGLSTRHLVCLIPSIASGLNKVGRSRGSSRCLRPAGGMRRYR